MAVARDLLNKDTITLLSEKFKAWDENFRVLTDINASLSRVEEDLRASRESRETKIPTSTPLIPREIRPVDGNFKPIILKDAIESVPVFDGHRPSVFQFLKACERARSMVPRNQEPYLVKLLMNKLRGHAIKDGVVLTLNDFGNRLKNMFGPGKTINEYKGELATVFQRPGEEILDYIDRVKNLRLAIMDGERCGFDTVSADVQDTIDWDTTEAFVKGLPNEVFVRVKLAGYQSLDDAFCQAVRATKELKQVNNRSRCQQLGNPNNYNWNGARPNNDNNHNNNRNINGNNRQDRRFVSPTQNRPTPRNNYNGNNTRPLYDSNNIRNHHQDWRFVSPSRNRLSDPGIEKDIRKRARAITWEEKCVNKHLKRDPSQRRDADYLKQPTFQYKHCSVAVIKDDVT